MALRPVEDRLLPGDKAPKRGGETDIWHCKTVRCWQSGVGGVRGFYEHYKEVHMKPSYTT